MDNSGRTLKVSQVWQAIQGLARVFTHTSLEKLVKQDQEEEEERPGDREVSPSSLDVYLSWSGVPRCCLGVQV